MTAHEIASGDILPAREAIAAIDTTDLGPPIEIPEVPADAFPETSNFPFNVYDINFSHFYAVN